MSWIPHFAGWQYAVAGAICAAGPIVIHLLNRRRFRTVDWAAMQFLLEALQRERRVLRLRDLLVLILRTAAVFFFGLAVARPYFSADGVYADTSSPRHLILLVDNSLSMAYRPLDATLLDVAKEEARQWIASLPDGSYISVLSTNGPWKEFREPARRKADALEQLDAIGVVDDGVGLEVLLAVARPALGAATPLPDQLVFVTDLQRANWPGDAARRLAEQIPALLVRDVSVRSWSNTWVSELRLRDDIVDLEMPATIHVLVRHRGPTARSVQATLSVAGETVATRTIDLAPGAAERKLTFQYTFSETAVEPGGVAFVPVSVSLTPDRLVEDDRRTIMVPVVASLPVVFVDQVSEEAEDPLLGRLGETRPLRQLLAPAPASRDTSRQMVDVRHVGLDELDREILSTARLLVIAGLAHPGEKLAVIREFVEQGGPAVIAAGGEFDPARWNETAWLDGRGILPCRLQEQPLGPVTVQGATSLVPFWLDVDSLLAHPWLRIAGLSDDELRDLYGEPLFFKAVGVDEPQGVTTGPETVTDASDNPTSVSPGLSENTTQVAPRWLRWLPPDTVPVRQPDPSSDEADAGTALRSRVEICGRFANEAGTPFLIRQQIGQGQVVLLTTGLLAEWNNLAQTNAVIVWDHLLRSLVRSTLSNMNYRPRHQLRIPLAAQDRLARVRLQRPGQEMPSDYLEVGFVGRQRYGVTIRDAWVRGLYRLSATAASDSEETAVQRAAQWQRTVAVNGEAGESDLTSLSGEELEQLFEDSRLVLLNPGATLGGVTADLAGQDYWWWLSLLVVALLLAEMGILAFSRR